MTPDRIGDKGLEMPASLLIVDDEPLIAYEVESTLMDAGYGTPTIAGTVEDALSRIAAATPETGPIDAAVIDANLAGQSAEPVAVALRERGIPFLVLSGYSRDQIGPWIGDAVVIRKPFRTDELLAAVNGLLARDQQTP